MRYRHGVPGLLVLWDVDHTLINAGRGGWRAYQLAFGQMFGRSVPAAPSMAGRTDRAIALETLALAGVPDPRTQVDAFQRSWRGWPRTWRTWSGSTGGCCPERPRRSGRWPQRGTDACWSSRC